MFRRIAIVNRGEPARRVIHAVRELAHERGDDLRTIALHTPAERSARFVREADEACQIGHPGWANPYLDHRELERALRACRADAAWVGWGFVAEDPDFADLCARIGVTFIGPSGDVMRRLGDKIAAKLAAEQVGVPMGPWSRGPVDDVAAAREHGARIGYPLMIKAAAGGGGRGIRRVDSETELAGALERARDEARRSFGDDRVLMEGLIDGGRHVEVQVIADAHGNAWALGVRDCSVQRRGQKLIEESRSPVLPAERERRLRESAVELVRAVGYCGAGTVEFLYRPASDTLSFLEVNTRLQVEHPVTEQTTGVDLVKLQLHVAAGGRLEGDPPPTRGHAIEARVNAEDPERGFAPAPGRVVLMSLPTGPGIRVDTGVGEGDEIPPEYDSMIAKVIAWGADRDEARSRLRRALRELTVVIDGGVTNRSFLIDLLERPEVVSGDADTGWLDRLGVQGELIGAHQADLALVLGAIFVDRAEEDLERERFYASARRGRPRSAHRITRTVDLRHRGQAYRLSVARTGPTDYRVSLEDGPAVDARLEPLGRFEWRVSLAGRTHRVVSVSQAPDLLVEVAGELHRLSRDEGGLVRAPAPALVVALTAAVGDRVSAGDSVAVLESMKMETALGAPCDGTVAEIFASENTQVDAGAPLLRIEPDGRESAPVVERARVDLSALGRPVAVDPRERAGQILEAMRSLVLGYDITGAEARRLVDDLRVVRERLPADDPVLLAGELDVLGVVADLADLWRARPSPFADPGDESVHSPREHFQRFLRSLDPEREGLPARLRASLERAASHYGVSEVRRSHQVADVAHRMFLAEERAAVQLPVVEALLDGRLGAVEALAEADRERLRETLDRLVEATQRRIPAIAELARGLRFRYFEQPLIAAARRERWEHAHRQLAYLVEHPDAPDRAGRIADLVASPLPLLPLLAERAATGVPAGDPLLEVLTRRYYKTRVLRDLRFATVDGRQVASGVYGRSGRRVRLVTAIGLWGDLAGMLRTAAAVMRGLPDAHGAVLDLYLAADEPVDPDEASLWISAAIARSGLPDGVRRVVVSLAFADGQTGQFTFRAGPAGMDEERATRGLHPMIWRRLRFWRIADFVVTRRPSGDDTHLFHCVSPGDPSDQRLVALAEVRDLTPVRAPDGTLTGLPEVQRVLLACLEDLRRERAARPDGRKLQANQVLMYIWPTLDIDQEALIDVARRLVPLTDGLGIEEVSIGFTAVDEETGGLRDLALRFSHRPGEGVNIAITPAPSEPLAPIDDYARKVLAARRRGAVYPYELVGLLAGEGGHFVEHDLDGAGCLVPVERPAGRNGAGIVVGLVSTPTAKHPEGVVRVALLGDPTRALGALAEAECTRVIAALDLAEHLGVPVEWFALSSGAKISRESGTENMDHVAAALRRIVLFTQAGGEINVVVAGINVGAQPYWNAEATMLMHTRGILVMTPDSAMVLTGKQALDYSGGVSAEDNFGLGGFDRIMGPNGQAQYWAPNLAGARDILMRHYAHSYVAPGEAGPRRAPTADPFARDVREAPHEGPGTTFTTVGDVFSPELNRERKKPFDIRSVMRAVIDADHPPLERWAQMADADTAVVFDAHLGGVPITLLGIESRPIDRHGFLPADGPDQWSAGTLFPLSSKKAARAINAASGNRPLVVLANLSGFDGSPESLRKWQLEYGAEIGRAVVNFDGPIVFTLISRYHGGAFVVFSGALNDRMQVLAVEGSYASVIGGAPAAAVVFAADVNARTEADPRVVEQEALLARADAQERGRLRGEADRVRASVRSQMLGEVAAEFDGIHSVERALEVGSVHAIIPAAELRPQLIAAIERGLAGGR